MVNKAELRQFIAQYFSDLELDELCFDYYPDLLNQFTVGMTKSQKVIALIGYAERRGRMNHLLTTLDKLRPEAYKERFGRVASVPPASPASNLSRNPEQIFLSHANQDVEFAHQLAADLRQNGFEVWIAPDSIEPGEKWVDAINRGLETSGIFLLVMTSDAAGSKWVRDETSYAIALENKEEMRLITLDVGEGRLPPLWSVRQHISFRRGYDEGLRQLLTTLRPNQFAAPPKPAPDGPVPGTESGKPFYWALGMVALLAVMFIGWRLMAGGVEGGDGNEVAGVTPATPSDEDSGVSANPTRTPTFSPTSTITKTPELSRTPTLTPTPNSQAGNIRTVSRGGVEVEQGFVPDGSFMMGREEGESDDQPVHEVTLDAFWIDRMEVTNAQFAAFAAHTGYRTTAESEGGGYTFVNNEWNYTEGADWQHPQGPSSNLFGLNDHPVVQVSWNDAQAFCEWAGSRLPSEAEWEYAARGPSNLVYPWGNSFDGRKLNYCDNTCPFDFADQNVDDGYEFTAPVGSYIAGASWAGVLDMAGNVLEWVNDWYEIDYYTQLSVKNPTGPESGDERVLRGGAWNIPNVPSADRGSIQPIYRDFNIGFRCAGD